MDPGLVRLTLFVGGLIVMLCAETLRPFRLWQISRMRRFLFHAGLSVFNTILLRYPVVIPLLMWRTAVSSKGWGILGVLGPGTIVGVAVTVAVLDMFDYWWHRLNHEVGFLWRFHKVHHVDTHVDVTTSLRFHPGELVLSSIVKSLWIFILGPSLLAYTAFESSITFAAQFHHSNIDFPDRVESMIRRLFVTPRYHAAHHTVCKRTGDANYSTIFIFWDKLFGTYREPDYGEMQTLGLAHGREGYLRIGPTLKGPLTSAY